MRGKPGKVSPVCPPSLQTFAKVFQDEIFSAKLTIAGGASTKITTRQAQLPDAGTITPRAGEGLWQLEV